MVQETQRGWAASQARGSSPHSALPTCNIAHLALHP